MKIEKDLIFTIPYSPKDKTFATFSIIFIGMFLFSGLTFIISKNFITLIPMILFSFLYIGLLVYYIKGSVISYHDYLFKLPISSAYPRVKSFEAKNIKTIELRVIRKILAYRVIEFTLDSNKRVHVREDFLAEKHFQYLCDVLKLKK